MIKEFKIHPWDKKPACKYCDKPSTHQLIDTDKLGTNEYSSYVCDDCREKFESH